MNVPLDAMGDLPEEHKAKLLRAIEAAQVRDRYAVGIKCKCLFTKLKGMLFSVVSGLEL